MRSNKTLLTEPGCGRATPTDGTLGKLPASVSTNPSHSSFDLFDIGFLSMSLIVPELNRVD